MRFKPLWILALLVALAFAYTPQAQAGGVVSTCNAASLITALAGGGIVRFTCSGTISLTATITISLNTRIDGTGQSVAISGGGAVRVFNVPSGVTLALVKLTIANGNITGGGGGINNSGTLTVINCTFSGNRASDGGGIDNSGTLTVTNCTFSGNSAGGDGGGIRTRSSGPVTVINSTFSGNSAGFDGGGIEIDSGGPLTVINSTFSGNSAIQGGGINNDSGVATITVTNSTLSGNSASQGGGIISSFGGTTILRNTIVANSPSGGNCGLNPITDGGGNLSWPDTTCPGINQDPKLDPDGLEINGGRTETIALLEGSAAIDAAVSANCPATDQRGVRRPAGLCDIGAFQLLPACVLP